jgi:hypothetical protein
MAEIPASQSAQKEIFFTIVTPLRRLQVCRELTAT